MKAASSNASIRSSLLISLLALRLAIAMLNVSNLPSETSCKISSILSTLPIN